MSWSSADGDADPRVRVRVRDDRHDDSLEVETLNPGGAELLRNQKVNDFDSEDIQTLTEVLLSKPVEERLSDYLGRPGAGRLRMILSFDQAPELAGLPWELSIFPKPAQERSAGLGPSRPLHSHENVGIVRSVDSADPPETKTMPQWGRVVTSTATTAQGRVHLPGGSPVFTATGTDNSDTALIRDHLHGSGFQVDDGGDPATAASIKAALSEPTYGFYFGGHHAAGHLIVCRSSTSSEAEPLSAGTLADWLVTAGAVVAVLVACDGGSPTTDAASSTAEQIAAAGVPFVIAVRGPIQESVALRFAEVFFREFAHGTELDMALSVASRDAGLGPGKGCIPVLYSCRPQHFAVAQRPAPELTSHLDAFWVPPGWRPGHDTGIGDQHRTSLDVLWCLDRQALRGVVAEQPGADLASAFNSVEHHAAGAACRKRGLSTRSWFAYDPRKGQPPALMDQIPEALDSRTYWALRLRSAPEGEGIGLVLRWSTDLEQSRARDYVLALGRLLPRSAIVVKVEGDSPDEAIAAADAIGRDVAADALAAGDATAVNSVAIVSRIRPGRPSVGRSNLTARQVLTAVGVDVTDFEERLPRAGASPGASWDAHDPLVEAVVTAIDTASAADPEDARRKIADIRRLFPDFYPSFAARHAAPREGHARFASLAAVCDSDADIDTWLEHAGAFPELDDLPLRLRTAQLIDSVLLAALRRRETAHAVRSWAAAAAIAPSDAWRLYEYVQLHGGPAGRRSAKQDGRFLQNLSYGVAVAADRARIRPLIQPSDFPHAERSPAWWALLGRRQLTEESALWLATLDVPFRRLVGLFSAQEDPGTPAAGEAIASLRGALRPPLPPVTPRR